MLVKLILVGALEGIGSMRELLRVAALRVDIRRFLGYGFTERLPVHQTISHAQTRRFVDARLFERLFLRSVALCREHGLIDGTHLSVDGFHVEANAALASLRASLVAVAGVRADADDGDVGVSAEAPAGGGEDEPGASAEAPAGADRRPQLALVEPRSGPTPKRRSSNQMSASLTDPDARLRGKPGQRPHLVHRGQVAVDPRARCVVACLGERADGHEGDALAPIADRARFACPQLASVGADQGFAAERVWRAMSERTIEAFVPPQRTMLPADGEPKTDAQRAAIAARKRCKTPAGVWSHGQRMADAEGVVGELKHRHGTRPLALPRHPTVPCRTAARLRRAEPQAARRPRRRRRQRRGGRPPDRPGRRPRCRRGGLKPAEGVQSRSITAEPAPGRPARRLTVPIWTTGLSLN